MKIRGLFVAFSCVFLAASTAQAQSASQAFRVVVPSSLAIVAPTGVSIPTTRPTTIKPFRLSAGR